MLAPDDKPTIRVAVSNLQLKRSVQFNQPDASTKTPGSVDASPTLMREFDVPATTTRYELMTLLRNQGYVVDSLQFDKDWRAPIIITVGEKDCFDEEVGLEIARSPAHWDTTLLEYHDQWLEVNGFKLSNEGDGDSRITFSKIGGRGLVLGGTTIGFNRTLRVPDNAGTYALPPGLGSFPLRSLASCKNVPQDLVARGGFILPIWQREALWLDFGTGASCPFEHSGMVLKVSVGGINAISGMSRNSDPANLDQNVQDYVVPGKQPWLDGICTEPGVVRQFVAMPLGQGYTVEEQLTGEATHGGIQFDLFERLNDQVDFSVQYMKMSDGLEKLKTPGELKLAEGVAITMKSRVPNLYEATIATLAKSINGVYSVTAATFNDRSLGINVRTLTGKVYHFNMSSSNTVEDLKAAILEKDGCLPVYQRLIFAGKRLDDGSFLLDSGITNDATVHFIITLRGGGIAPAVERSMGFSAGGRIKQDIVCDELSVRTYGQTPAHRAIVHTVNSQMWERLTGTLPPISPIKASTYKKSNLPWFTLYNEHPATNLSGQFQNVLSLAEVDAVVSKKILSGATKGGRPPFDSPLDPRNPPDCSTCDDRKAASVFRPCCHVACDECLRETIEAKSHCVVCGVKVKRFVGFMKPVDLKKLLEMVEDKEIEGVAVDDKSAWTIRLDADRVSKLNGRV